MTVARARPGTIDDAAAVASIYNHYVTDTIVTFEEQPVTTPDMQSRMAVVLEKLPWLVFEHDGAIAGYAYASPWKSRKSGADSVPRCTKACSTTCARGTCTA
jgi:phosphinothricin acetyltransferase